LSARVSTQPNESRSAGLVADLEIKVHAWAYVTNGTMSFQVPEADYRAFGASIRETALEDYIATKLDKSPTPA
jgi:hypothetical protein